MKEKEENGMAFFQVTSSELRNKADTMKNLNLQFQAKATALEEKETALCSMWEGKTRNTFHQAFSRDREQMDAFSRLIEQYIQALLEIANRYEQAEARNYELASARSY